MAVAQLQCCGVGIGLTGAQSNLGVPLGEVLDDQREQGGSGGAEHADFQLDGKGVAGVLDRGPRFSFGGKDDLGMLEKDPSDVRQTDPAAATIEDARADVALEGAELLRDSRG